MDTWIYFFIAGTICAIFAFMMRNEEHGIGTQVGLWLITFVALCASSWYFFVSPLPRYVTTGPENVSSFGWCGVSHFVRPHTSEFSSKKELEAADKITQKDIEWQQKNGFIQCEITNGKLQANAHPWQFQPTDGDRTTWWMLVDDQTAIVKGIEYYLAYSIDTRLGPTTDPRAGFDTSKRYLLATANLRYFYDFAGSNGWLVHFRMLPLLWRCLIVLVLAVALIAQSSPIVHHLKMGRVHGQTEHTIALTVKETAETHHDRATSARVQGYTAAEVTPVLVAKLEHDENIRQRTVELPVKKQEANQDRELAMLIRKESDAQTAAHAEVMQNLEIMKARAMAKMDIKKEKAKFENGVAATIKLQLAPEHQLLEVHRLLMESLPDLSHPDMRRRAAATKLFDHFTAKFDELAKKKTA